MSRIITYPAGSGFIVWNSLTLNLRKAFKITDKPALTKVPSATLGDDHDSRLTDILSSGAVQPKILVSTLAAQLAAFYPFTDPTTQNGSLIFPGTDLPLVLKLRDGKTVTYPAAAISKMAPLAFSSDKPLLNGDLEFTMLTAGASNVGDAASHETVGSASYTEPVWDPSDELAGDAYSLQFGVTGLTAGATTNGASTVAVASTAGLLVGQAITGTGIPAATTVATITDGTHLTLSANATATNADLALTTTPLTVTPDKDGITFTPTVTLEPVKPGNNATRNYRVKSIGGVLEFRPLDVDVDVFYAKYLPMQGQNVKLGGSVRAAGFPALVSGSASGRAQLTVPLVGRAKDSALEVNNIAPRVDKVQLMALQTTSGGAWQPLFTLGVVD
ncbi:MAG: hypothetical protein P4L99_21665 [Chthoniobacter sp.]|nr:hypothetical protein [Chthoniobacter sp.]